MVKFQGKKAALKRLWIDVMTVSKTTHRRACQTELILRKLLDKAKFGQNGEEYI
jgi:hypothetical protein